MKLEYKIDIFPYYTHSYHLMAYTEGVLRLVTKYGVFLDADGILLVELATCLKRWIYELRDAQVDFYYRSMDFEEEPILAFVYEDQTDSFILESVWSDKSGIERAPYDEVIDSVDKYLAELHEQLQAEHGIDLYARIEEDLNSD